MGAFACSHTLQANPETLRRAASFLPAAGAAVQGRDQGIKIKAALDTIYETDNGLEDDEEGYQEYYAAAVRVLAIVVNPKPLSAVKVGALKEISMQNPPKAIWLEDGTTAWSDTAKNDTTSH